MHDPDSYTILNNIGVVSRELGRLDRSEAAAARRRARRPASSSGTTTSGTRCSSRASAPRRSRAYEEGQRLDPEKNRRQGCRLAIVRLANGDIAGAERGPPSAFPARRPEERATICCSKPTRLRTH